MKKCRICEMEFQDPALPCPDCGEMGNCGHHSEIGPVLSGLCLGCWTFLVAAETFVLQKTGRTMFALNAEEDLRQIIAKYSKKGVGREQIIRR